MMKANRPDPGDAGIFYNFQVDGIAPRKEPSAKAKAAASSDNKPIKTTHACVECKRRKIRCDGGQPCHQCLLNRIQKRCLYDKRRPRVLTSRKTVEDLSQSLEECRSIINRLYPNREISSLLLLTRQELVVLLDKPTPDGEALLLSPPPVISPIESSEASPGMDPKYGMANLEQIPSDDAEWDEERRERDPIPVEADDINALSLAMDKRASYLGASSIKAALTVMLKMQPRLNESLKPTLRRIDLKKHSTPHKRQAGSDKEEAITSNSWKKQMCIDAYFKRVHVFIPMLDEAAFRAEVLQGERKDSPWLALLNAVLAMGSIAASKSSDLGHFLYYNRAMDHLSIDAFGSSRVETIQALAIIGGFYLHYVNRPNMANALLGSTMRMACALGLHREPPSHSQSPEGKRAAEVRRRTWWSLFCLDTWGSTTMGRPSFGRWGPAINILPPELGINQVVDSSQHAGILPMIENIRFCKIATHIQDVLATTPFPSAKDRDGLDLQLRTWYENLPWLLRTTAPGAEQPLYIARCVMKWRYQNLRMLLHRHILLAMASRAEMDPTPEDSAAIEVCWTMARETIADISAEWTRTQMLGWNAAWFLYQSVMIPLVSIFWQQADPRASEWRKSIELVIELLDRMEDWSVTASRSRDVVQQIYNFILQKPGRETDDPSYGGSGSGINLEHGPSGMSSHGFNIDDLLALEWPDWGWDLDGMFWDEPAVIPQNGCDPYQANQDATMATGFDIMDFPGMATYSDYFGD
ncbi:Lactose regulatory protein LAC9 [Paramyrothecium foliicola]|nr:Lactose regulatory protein LAC9 [Paramyrothecium foliicola]